MAGFLTDLVLNIFTPGAGRSLLVASNVAFAALQLTLGALVIGTYGDEWSIHFAIMSVICAGLWAAVNWFVPEYNRYLAKTAEAERIEKERAEKDQEKTEGTDAETIIGTEDTGSGSKEVEVVEQKGELIDRTAKTTTLGDAESGVDDDWEKVGPVVVSPETSPEKNKDK